MNLNSSHSDSCSFVATQQMCRTFFGRIWRRSAPPTTVSTDQCWSAHERQHQTQPAVRRSSSSRQLTCRHQDPPVHTFATPLLLKLYRRTFCCSWTWETSDSWTCHAVISDIHRRHFNSLSGIKAQCVSPLKRTLEILLHTSVFTSCYLDSLCQCATAPFHISNHSSLGRHITQSTDDHRESAFLCQRLSVLIQRYNAVTVSAIPSPTQPPRMKRSRSSTCSSF